MQSKRTEEKAFEKKIRINTIIKGEPAIWLEEWKKNGLITSYTDAVLQGLSLVKEKISLNELKYLQLENLKELN
jgi:hypothetical protein